MKTANRFLDLLTFLRIVDRHDGTVSLSAAALGVTTTAATLNPSWPSVALALIATAGYAHRRYQNQAQSRHDSALASAAGQIAALASQVSEAQRLAKATDDRLTRAVNSGGGKLK